MSLGPRRMAELLACRQNLLRAAFGFWWRERRHHESRAELGLSLICRFANYLLSCAVPQDEPITNRCITPLKASQLQEMG